MGDLPVLPLRSRSPQRTQNEIQFLYIYTSISIASISFTGRMKFIPRWTPLALSPRKDTENTNDVRNSPLFLECCYFKIASTRC